MVATCWSFRDQAEGASGRVVRCRTRADARGAGRRHLVFGLAAGSAAGLAPGSRSRRGLQHHGVQLGGVGLHEGHADLRTLLHQRGQAHARVRKLCEPANGSLQPTR